MEKNEQNLTSQKVNITESESFRIVNIMGISILFLFVSVPYIHGLPTIPKPANETKQYVYDTLSALEAALQFLDKDHMYVNLDAIIGTRIVEGQFKVLLQRIENSPGDWQVDQAVVNKIRQLQQLSGEISEKAIPFIATFTPKYYQEIGPLLRKRFWEIDYPSRSFPVDTAVWEFREGEAVHESDSDDCIGELFGTGKISTVPCDISSECWTLMTSKGYNGYSLSHEIFYLEIGQMAGCSPQMERMRKLLKQPEIDQLQTLFCANMLAEAKMIADTGYYHRRQDLFMEDAALCGMLGFRQFFISDWLHSILSWQNKEMGCFMGNPIRETDVDFRPGALRLRQKREERRLEHGCLAHRTTVAISALSQYVRYMLEFAAFVSDGHLIS